MIVFDLLHNMNFNCLVKTNYAALIYSLKQLRPRLPILLQLHELISHREILD